MANKIETEEPPKREAILTAARTLFVEKGYEEATIADIAKQAGIAVGTVYLYFRNKHDIYTAVALDLQAQLANTFQDPALLELPLAEVLTGLVENIFRFSREFKQLMGLLQVDIQSSEENEQHRLAHERISMALTRIFERAIARGELMPFPSDLYAQMLNVMGRALLHQCFAIEHGERAEEFRVAFTDLLQRLFFGPALHEQGSERA